MSDDLRAAAEALCEALTRYGSLTDARVKVAYVRLGAALSRLAEPSAPAPAPSEAEYACPACGRPDGKESRAAPAVPDEECHHDPTPDATGRTFCRFCRVLMENGKPVRRGVTDEEVVTDLLVTLTYCSQMHGEPLGDYVQRWVRAVRAAEARARKEGT